MAEGKAGKARGDEKQEKSAVSHKKEHIDMAKSIMSHRRVKICVPGGDYEANSSRDMGSSVLVNNRGKQRSRNVIFEY